MTPEEFKSARKKLGLTQEQYGLLLGYSGKHVKSQIHKMETGAKPITPARASLVRAWLAGHPLERLE